MSNINEEATKLWGGRFTESVDKLLEKFNNSLRIDHKMWEADLTGSSAYANALMRVNLITKEEHEKITTGIDQVKEEWKENKFLIKGSDEDIHTANERRLCELIGKETGGKLHTGRSRNDQCTTDVCLWLKQEINLIKSDLISLLEALANRAEKEIDILMPGYTHLQRAQPIRWSHWLMSYACDFSNDLKRLINDVMNSADVMTLGSGALAGNPFNVDRELLAKDLKFRSLTKNSLSATASRDMISHMLFWCTQVGGHLSRFAEDLILYSSKEFSFVQLSDAFSTGSSIMPQKKNPDSLELIRGKSGTLIGKVLFLNIKHSIIYILLILDAFSKRT